MKILRMFYDFPNQTHIELLTLNSKYGVQTVHISTFGNDSADSVFGLLKMIRHIWKKTATKKMVRIEPFSYYSSRTFEIIKNFRTGGGQISQAQYRWICRKNLWNFTIFSLNTSSANIAEFFLDLYDINYT